MQGWEETKKHLAYLAKLAASNPIEKRPKAVQLDSFITDDSIGLQGKVQKCTFKEQVFGVVLSLSSFRTESS
jgi:hypothetical protein